jgi:antitoxin MazE
LYKRKEFDMQAQIGKWGNSLAVRIPGAYAKDLNLQEGMEVDLLLMDGALVLRPQPREYTLDELVSRITPENVHEETNWGPDIGKEAG